MQHVYHTKAMYYLLVNAVTYCIHWINGPPKYEPMGRCEPKKKGL